MRPQLTLRVAVALAAVGALFSISQPAAAQAPGAEPTPSITVTDSRLVHGQLLTVRGRAPGASGRQVELQFRAAGTTTWRAVNRTTADAEGRFVARTRPATSGIVRAVLLPAAGARTTTPATPAAASSERGVSVAGRFRVTGRTLDVGRGDLASVRGTLDPGKAGRLVTLQRADDGRWRTVARDRTDDAGRFRVGVRVRETGSAPVRVRFGGDAANTGTSRIAGRLNVYRSALASWYWLYGSPVACGGTLGRNDMTVAHKTLPCGTRLTIRYKGRTARAVVRDRGPYVGGREFDLAGAVARKIGFSGVGRIQVAIER